GVGELGDVQFEIGFELCFTRVIRGEIAIERLESGGFDVDPRAASKFSVRAIGVITGRQLHANGDCHLAARANCFRRNRRGELRLRRAERLCAEQVEGLSDRGASEEEENASQNSEWNESPRAVHGPFLSSSIPAAEYRAETTVLRPRASRCWSNESRAGGLIDVNRRQDIILTTAAK